MRESEREREEGRDNLLSQRKGRNVRRIFSSFTSIYLLPFLPLAVSSAYRPADSP